MGRDVTEEPPVRLHTLFRGHVQGVGFRWTVREHAGRLRLTGWVRNRRDGTVEMETQGPRPAVERLLAGLTDAFGAGITGREDRWSPATGTETAFEIRPTA
jgi:acylphosphatase